MSLQPTAIPPVPDETARIAKKVFKRKGNLYLVIGDQIGTLFEKIDFADLFPSDGAPAFSPNLLALVAVFQRLEIYLTGPWRMRCGRDRSQVRLAFAAGAYGV